MVFIPLHVEESQRLRNPSPSTMITNITQNRTRPYGKEFKIHFSHKNEEARNKVSINEIGFTFCVCAKVKSAHGPSGPHSRSLFRFS